MKHGIRLLIGGMIMLTILGLFSGCGKKAAEIGKDFPVGEITGLRLENRSDSQEEAFAYTVMTGEDGALSLEISRYDEIDGDRIWETVVPDPTLWDAIRASLAGKKLQPEGTKAPDKGMALFLQKNREESWRLVRMEETAFAELREQMWDASDGAPYLPSGFDYSELVAFSIKEVASMAFPGDSLIALDRKDGKWIAAYQVAGQQEPQRKEVDDAFAGTVLTILKEYDLGSWDGFDRTAKNVLDGSRFECSLVLGSGEKASASGSNSFPRGYHDVWKDLRTLYLTVFPQN